MKSMNEEVVTLIGDNNEKIICDILFTYYSEVFDKNYVVFNPRGTDECSAASYVTKEDGTSDLSEITSDDEWAELEELLDEYYENINKK